MPIWLLSPPSSIIDKIQGQPFSLKLTAHPITGEAPFVATSDNYDTHYNDSVLSQFMTVNSSGSGIPHTGVGRYGSFLNGWRPIKDGYIAELGTSNNYSTGSYIFSYQFVDFPEDVDFSFDVDCRSEYRAKVNADDPYPEFGRVFRFRVQNPENIGNEFVFLGDISNVVYDKTIGTYGKETVTAKIPAGPHYLVFEYMAVWLTSGQEIVSQGWGNYIGHNQIWNRYDDYNDLSWLINKWGSPPPADIIADNSCVISNFTPIMPEKINVYCPGTGVIRDVVEKETIHVKPWNPTEFVGLIDYLGLCEVSVNSLPAMCAEFTQCNPELITVNGFTLSNTWTVPPASISFVKYIYIAKLTGTQVGIDDLWLPISSCTARRRSGEPSYLSVVVPAAVSMEAEISARSGGELIIYKGIQFPDGSRNLEEIAAANFDYLRIDQGGKNQSGTLVGYRQKTYSNPVDRKITEVSYRAVTTEGKTRLRGAVNLFVDPGDTCVYGDISFTINLITYTITPRMSIMEVAE